MCGISGWFSHTPLADNAGQHLEQMVQSINHRGPDGQGQKLYRHAALGHTRLAIIDLQQGAQPMSRADGAVCISFNGEIYNYRELQTELRQQGLQFVTDSDTEVILQLFIHQGVEGFARLQGMFALAIWDNRIQTGYLLRDSLGIKPLFYTQHKQQLIFGSEAKAILQYPGFDSQLDTHSLHLLLNYRYLPQEHSLFRHIKQLAPGTILKWSRADGIHHCRFSAPAGLQSSVMETLQASVKSHLVADVDVGCYLSGGIDSATISALASREQSTPLRTFTLKTGDDPKEAENAARTAELLSIRNDQQEIHIEAEHVLPKLVWHLETPKINALQVYLLAQFTAQHVKVALSGLGSDELFLGYYAHGLLHRLHSLSRYLPASLSRAGGYLGTHISRMLAKTPWTETERGWHMLQAIPQWHRVYAILRNIWDSPQMRHKVYGPRMLDQALPDAFEHQLSNWPKTYDDPVKACQHYEWHNKMVNDLLWQEDRLSMAHGLEVRVPFVTPAFHTLITDFSREQLMGPSNTPKYLLKTQLQSLLPQEILNRTKSGFQVPAPQFYKQHLESCARIYLQRSKVEQHGIFNADYIQHLQSLPASTKYRWHYFFLYFALLTHIWLDQFEQGHKP